MSTTRVTVILPDTLYRHARAQLGARGLAPRMRDLLAADLDRDDQAHAEPPAPTAASKQQQPDPSDTPRSGQPCPHTGCHGTIRTMQGRPRCSAAPRHTWPAS